MYYHLDGRLIEAMLDQRIEGTEYQACLGDPACHSSLARAGWFRQRALLLLGQLGTGLVALGRRLERYAVAQSFPCGEAHG